jgi:hypothetical protein
MRKIFIHETHERHEIVRYPFFVSFVDTIWHLK